MRQYRKRPPPRPINYQRYSLFLVEFHILLEQLMHVQLGSHIVKWITHNIVMIKWSIVTRNIDRTRILLINLKTSTIINEIITDNPIISSKQTLLREDQHTLTKLSPLQTQVTTNTIPTNTITIIRTTMEKTLQTFEGPYSHTIN